MPLTICECSSLEPAATAQSMLGGTLLHMVPHPYSTWCHTPTPHGATPLLHTVPHPSTWCHTPLHMVPHPYSTRCHTPAPHGTTPLLHTVPHPCSTRCHTLLYLCAGPLTLPLTLLVLPSSQSCRKSISSMPFTWRMRCGRWLWVGGSSWPAHAPPTCTYIGQVP